MSSGKYMVKDRNVLKNPLSAASVLALFATTLAVAQQIPQMASPVSSVDVSFHAEISAQVAAQPDTQTYPGAGAPLIKNGYASQWGPSRFSPESVQNVPSGSVPGPSQQNVATSGKRLAQALANQSNSASQLGDNLAVHRIVQPAETGEVLGNQDMSHMAGSLSPSLKSSLKFTIHSGAADVATQSASASLNPFAKDTRSPFGHAFGKKTSTASGSSSDVQSQKKKHRKAKAELTAHGNKSRLSAEPRQR